MEVTIVIFSMLLAIAALFIETIYITIRRPSKYQTYMLILTISTIVMLAGYISEITAQSVEASMLGCGISYLGKPFAMLASVLFTAEFCNVRISKKLFTVWALFSILFPVLVFSNGYHHLYYATVYFDRTRPFSPLILTHGPLYYLYMLNLGLNFSLMLFYMVRSYIRANSAVERQQLLYLLATFGSSAIGYLLYLAGITMGFDTTMAGAVIGAVFLAILFTRYRLFDTLTLAKDQALDNLSCGLLVLNSDLRCVYANHTMEQRLSEDVQLQELQTMPDGDQTIIRNGNVYELIKRTVSERGRDYGKNVELTDVTAKYNYSTRLEQEVELRTKEIKEMQRSLITSFAGIVEARDSSTGQHINRMKGYVENIARQLVLDGRFTEELTPEYIHCLVDVAPLHDLGKLVISDSILKKPGRLTDEEFSTMKTHTSEGARIIATCLEGVESREYINMASEVALYHHEKWDGSGYPNHLSGSDIPLSARISAVADVFDAVLSERCYKPPMDFIQAKQLLIDGKGAHFDPVIVDAFLETLPLT